MSSDIIATLNDPIWQSPVPRPMAMDPRWRANIDPAPNCPRCASSNTKFCYYNNYSLSQPRFFCKGCRRYWTKGGSLRKVPVGGGCRKIRRSRSKALANSNGGSGSANSINPSTNLSSDSRQDQSNPHDIDMAAVFARFLTNDQTNDVNEINEDTTTNTTSETSHDSFTSTSVVFDQEFQMTDKFTPSNYQDFVTSDFATFDEIVDGVFWSNDLTWQPMPELEELDSSLFPSDQSTISTNSLSYDDWSGFDNMVYEAFTRH